MRQVFNTSGGGGSTFIGLSDGPGAFTGKAGLTVKVNAGETALEYVALAGGGDVTGPASATDNAIARFDTASGKVIQNSVVTIADTTGNMAGVGTLGCGAITSSGTLALGANSITMTGSLAATGARVLKGWFTDLECTNAIAGSVTGTAATVTGATQAAITTCANLVTVGTIATGTWAAAIGACTGTIDFGGATSFEIPNGAAPTVDAIGEIALDTTDNTLIVFDGTAARVMGHAVHSFTATIDVGAGWDNQTIPIWQAPKDMAVTLTQVNATCVAGTSLTFTIEERAYASLGSAGTVITAAAFVADTDGQEVTSFTNPGIAAKAHLVMVTGASAASGAVTSVTITGYYTKDVE